MKRALFLCVLIVTGCFGGPTKLKEGETTEAVVIASALAAGQADCYTHMSQNSLSPEQVTALKEMGQVMYYQAQMVTALVTALTAKGPCAGAGAAMAAYFDGNARAAVANAQFAGRAVGVAAIPLGILATGIAFEGVADAAANRTSIEGSNFTFSNSGTSGAAAGVPGGEGMEGVAGVPGDGGMQNRVMNVNIGGEQGTTTQTNFASGVIGQAEKQTLNKDSPNSNPIVDDSGDGSGNEAGLLQ